MKVFKYILNQVPFEPKYDDIKEQIDITQYLDKKEFGIRKVLSFRFLKSLSLILLVLCVCILFVNVIRISSDKSNDEINIANDEVSDLNVLNKLIDTSFENNTYPYWNLETKILSTLYGDLMLYNLTPVENSVKYIAGYSKFHGDQSELKWINYYDVNYIKKEDDGLLLTYLFAVFKGEMVPMCSSDLNSKIDVKYYYQYHNFDKINEFELAKEYIVWTNSQSTTRFNKIKEHYDVTFFPVICNLANDVESLYKITEVGGKKYIELELGYINKYTESYIDFTRSEFGQFYDEISKIILKDEKFIEDFDGNKRYYGKIEVSNIVSIIVERSNG